MFIMESDSESETLELQLQRAVYNNSFKLFLVNDPEFEVNFKSSVNLKT